MSEILTKQNKILDTSILLNGDNMQNESEHIEIKKQENLTVEYGKENLKDILSDYLKQKFIDILKEN